MLYDIEDIESFLKFGYFLDYKNPKYSFEYSGINEDKYRDCSEIELLKIGSDLFIDSIDKRFRSNSSHVVPISGGLDSRAILAGLLEFTNADNIHTYTFGTPNSLDYDIGNKLAEKLGTKHVDFPLTQNVYNMDELLDISKRVDHQTVLFHHPPIWKLDDLFKGKTLWSGFLGGELTDARHVRNISAPEIYETFLEKEYYQRKVNLTKYNDNKHFYSKLTVKNTNNITKFENLDYENRQLKFLAPHVLMNGFTFKTPFLDQNLFDFYLSIDNKYRKDQYLYKKILLHLFPELFSYPVKNNAGLPLNTSKQKIILTKGMNKIKRKVSLQRFNKNVNYLDFDKQIREKSDLNEIIRLNIYDLKNRNIINWIDVVELYKSHIEKKFNYGNALLLLASLEIHMKSKEQN